MKDPIHGLCKVVAEVLTLLEELNNNVSPTAEDGEHVDNTRYAISVAKIYELRQMLINTCWGGDNPIKEVSE